MGEKRGNDMTIPRGGPRTAALPGIPGEKRDLTPNDMRAGQADVGSAPASSPRSILLIITVVAAGLAALYLIGARTIVAPVFTDPVGPRAFPTLIAGGLFASAIVMLIGYLQARRSGETEPASGWASFSWTVPGVVVWTLAYLALFEWLGYVIATALYIVPLMMYFNRRRPLVNIVVGGGFSLASYVCLAVLLGAQLPTGTLVESLLH
jgi:putative tricarboxylic transport membrane protein